jgi:hypothetical protein
MGCLPAASVKVGGCEQVGVPACDGFKQIVLEEHASVDEELLRREHGHGLAVCGLVSPYERYMRGIGIGIGIGMRGVCMRGLCMRGLCMRGRGMRGMKGMRGVCMKCMSVWEVYV